MGHVHAEADSDDLADLIRDFEETETKDRNFLPEEVRTADLTKITDTALEGRLTYYQRDALFERNETKRAEFQREVQRTQLEINRRAMYRRSEAERVFKL